MQEQTEDRQWLAAAVDLALENVPQGGGPFGAIVVRDRAVLARGTNRVTTELDPTAHAEVEAIRRACQRVCGFSLVGATLYASCEPCPLCLAAALWARIPRIVYAADRNDAARAGFDDALFHEVISFRGGSGIVEVTQLEIPGALRPFDAWLRTPDRVLY